MKSAVTEEVRTFRDATEWKSWLAERHRESRGIWLQIAKKASGKTSITISDALDVALCYGWIDSQRKSLDQDYYLQRFSKRQRRSPWSKLNVKLANALIASRRMRAAGLAEIARAKNDGRWAAAYGSQRNAPLPSEFIEALKLDGRARAAFERLNKTAQYALVLPVLKVTCSEVRRILVQKTVAKLRRARSLSNASNLARSIL